MNIEKWKYFFRFMSSFWYYYNIQKYEKCQPYASLHPIYNNLRKYLLGMHAQLCIPVLANH